MNSISQDKRAEQIERLRNIVIRQHVRMASGGHTVPNGWSCKLCGAESGTNQELIHKPGCLTGSFSALRTPPADMEGAREQVIEGLVAAICDPECPTQFTPLLMEARKMLASVSALQRTEWQPIETAPVDGREIEVKYLTDDPRRVRWSRSREGSGWHLTGGHTAAILKFMPTHWRPAAPVLAVNTLERSHE